MSDTNKKILLVLGAILILVATFMFVIKPKRESIKGLEAQILELQARYDDLCEKEKHKDEYIAETAEFNEQFDEVVANYPADLNQETTVMFMKGVEESVDFVNDAFQMPRESSFYVLGQGAPDGSEISDDEEEPYICMTDAYSIAYNGSYEGLKDYLAYIADYKFRMAISSVSIAYSGDATDPLDECVGNIILNAYAISGPDRVPEKPVVSVEEGKDNIFESINGSVSESVSYDSDNGAAIAANHSLVILLNSADNDTSSGIIVASNESNEDTYVTSSSANVETLDISVTNEDGKNYVTYAIGSKSYKAEVLSKDVTVYVKSSSRTGSDDTNGVKVNVTNSTDLGVYIKVEGDDSSNPRFNMGSKSGTVKVY
ncbi:Tfp pilus assembly protein PilO [Lachnospiraceae bacterium NE2001]|nr:Tfp pilus assembly protein PilO [Lachnospiraceae bacterium NE2001]